MRRNIFGPLVLAGAVAALACATPAGAQTSDEYAFSLPAQDLSASLRAISVQTGQSIVVSFEPNLYRELAEHPRVARLAGLSGGYGRQKACAALSRNVGMIASFSRALLQDLRVGMTDEQFDAALRQAIDEIYRASTHASG